MRLSYGANAISYASAATPTILANTPPARFCVSFFPVSSREPDSLTRKSVFEDTCSATTVCCNAENVCIFALAFWDLEETLTTFLTVRSSLPGQRYHLVDGQTCPSTPATQPGETISTARGSGGLSGVMKSATTGGTKWLLEMIAFFAVLV